MLLAVRLDLSFGLITGPSGTGKTLVSQMILSQLDDTKFAPVLVLVSPGMGKTALLKEILSEMSVPLPGSPFVSAQDLLKLLGEAVMELHRQGRKPVFIIDEGHFLSAESLHMIRTISNIELPERKLTTCLLFAEERFMKRLQHPSYDSLRSRMYMRAELGPLNDAECAQYLQYRLLVAGRMEELFQPAALAAIYAHTGGICRNTSKLAMLSLLEGFAARSPLIEESHVLRAASLM
jgi:general secretion pathway protein A